MQKPLPMEPNKISDNDILRHKDFDALMHSYRVVKPAMIRRKRIIILTSAAAVLSACILLYIGLTYMGGPAEPGNDGDELIVSQNFNVLQEKVVPPLRNYVPETEVFELNTASGGTFICGTGSSVKIPASAFVDSKGQKISGQVELRYREFHNPVDFFLSGIPMHFKQGGQAFQFESGGMFEILAFSEGKEVFLAENRKISVEMNSAFGGEQSAFYYDPDNDEWVRTGSSLLTSASAAGKEERPTLAPKDSIRLPVMPRKADRRKDILNLIVDLSRFPELADYKGVMFEVNESYKAYDDKLNGVSWKGASLKSSDRADQYLLTLEGRDSSVTFMVYPVFSNKDYEQAMQVYQVKKQEAEEEYRKSVRQNTPFDPSGRNDERVADALNLVDRIDYASLEPLGKRKFEISELGIYQAANLIPIPDQPLIKPFFTDLAGKPLDVAWVYLADRTRNILFTFAGSDAFAYLENTPVLFWVVTRQGEMGILSPESFSAMVAKGNPQPVMPLNLTNPEDGVGILRSYFSI